MVKEDNTPRETLTIRELVENYAVPLGVRFWLTQYLEQGEKALARYNTNLDEATMEQAKFIYDVLDTKYQSVQEHEFPEAARDYIESYLYALTEGARIHVWSDPDLAVHALPVLLDCCGHSVDGDPTTAALRLAIEALTTLRERRHFLRDAEEGDGAKEDRDYYAAMKLSRYIASPDTPEALRLKLKASIYELTTQLQICADHPALVERAATLAFESVKDESTDPQGQVAKRLYDELHKTLGALPELPSAKE